MRLDYKKKLYLYIVSSYSSDGRAGDCSCKKNITMSCVRVTLSIKITNIQKE